MKTWNVEEMSLDPLEFGDSLGIDKINEGNCNGMIFKVKEL